MGLGNGTRQIEKRGMARDRGPHVRIGSSRGDGIQESARVRFCFAGIAGISRIISRRSRGAQRIRCLGRPVVEFLSRATVLETGIGLKMYWRIPMRDCRKL